MLGLPLKSIIVGKRKGLVVREAFWKLPDDAAELVKSTQGRSIFLRTEWRVCLRHVSEKIPNFFLFFFYTALI